MTVKPRILIVDDNHAAGSYTLLIKEQVDCVIVATWERFHELLENGEVFDVAIIMPLIRSPDRTKHNFLDVIRLFRERYPNTPIFAHCTATTFHADIKRAGATDVALRPRDIEQLLRQHLTLPSLH